MDHFDFFRGAYRLSSDIADQAEADWRAAVDWADAQIAPIRKAVWARHAQTLGAIQTIASAAQAANRATYQQFLADTPAGYDHYTDEQGVRRMVDRRHSGWEEYHKRMFSIGGQQFRETDAVRAQIEREIAEASADIEAAKQAAAAAYKKAKQRAETLARAEVERHQNAVRAAALEWGAADAHCDHDTVQVWWRRRSDPPEYLGTGARERLYARACVLMARDAPRSPTVTYAVGSPACASTLAARLRRRGMLARAKGDRVAMPVPIANFRRAMRALTAAVAS